MPGFWKRNAKSAAVAVPASVHGPSRRARWVKRAVAAAIVTSGAVLLPAPSAQAYTAPNGAVWYPVSDYCDPSLHSLYAEQLVLPQPNWSSQYITRRTYMLDLRTNLGQWSAWSAPILVYASSSTLTVGGQVSMPVGGHFRFYREVQWWNGSSWGSRVGAWDNYFEIGLHGSGAVAYDHCWT